MDTFDIGGELTVGRLGFGAMRVTGDDIIGEPADVENARAVLRRAGELVDLIDTADSYGPGVSERLIGETLAPYEDVAVATGPAARTVGCNCSTILREHTGGYRTEPHPFGGTAPRSDSRQYQSNSRVTSSQESTTWAPSQAAGSL